MTVYNITDSSRSQCTFKGGAVYGVINGATIADAITSDGMVGQYQSGGNYYISRLALMFDTSVIPKHDTIVSVKLRLWCYLKMIDPGGNFDLVIQNGTPQNPHDPLVVGDYSLNWYDGNDGNFNTVINTASISEAAQFDIDLSTIGLYLINQEGGLTRLMLRSSKDLSDTAPPLNSNEYIYIYTFAQGAAHLPELIVTTSPPVQGSGTMLEFLSLSSSDIAVDASQIDRYPPNVVVSGLPTGYGISRSEVLIKCRCIEDSSGSPNWLELDTYVQISKGIGPYVTFITFLANIFETPAGGRSDGFHFTVDKNLQTLITGPDTYRFRMKVMSAHGTNLILRDIQCGIKLYLKNI